MQMVMSKKKSGKKSWNDEFMSSEEYEKMTRKVLDELFDMNTSPLDLAVHAFGTLYEHASAYMWLEKKDGIEIEVAFHDDVPSIHFDFLDVIESVCDFDPKLNDQSVENINKVILSLEELRERIKNGEFNQ
jgi:hypothetical protein